MGQYFMLINLTHREAAVSLAMKFSSFIYECNNNKGIEQNLAAFEFPAAQAPDLISCASKLHRSQLGLLSTLPAELIDMIFEHLDETYHVAHFTAAHPLLHSHGFSRLLEIRTKALENISWHHSKIALVGDYLKYPEGIQGLLSDTLRAQVLEAKERIASEEGRERDLSLYEYAGNNFGGVLYNSIGPWASLELKEKEVLDAEGQPTLPPGTDAIANVDQRRIDRLLQDTRATFPSSDTAVLCNLTKEQFVCAPILREVEMDMTGYPLSLGTAVLFLTVCTDDWHFASDQGIMGAWAGDALVVLEPDRVPRDWVDISDEVADTVESFIKSD